MNNSKKKKPALEVSSDPIMAELVEIKERVSALEDVAGLVNQPAIAKHLREVLNTRRKREIMAALREPKSKAELVQLFAFANVPALDYHFNPIRETSFLHTDHSGEVLRFTWSPLAKRIQKSKMEAILNGSPDA